MKKSNVMRGGMVQVLICALMLCCVTQLHGQPGKPKTGGEVEIKAVIFHDLVGKNNTRTNYGAFFLHCSKEEVPALKAEFKNWSPRIEIGSITNVVQTNGRVLDKVTSNPAMIYSVEIDWVKATDAKAYGRYYSGSTGGANFLYLLKWSAGKWVIVSKTLKVVS